MRIYIHTDMEGVAGIGDGALLQDPESEAYRNCCELFMQEINAAARGFFAGGATQVMALDSHRGGGNFIPELLDPNIEWENGRDGIWWRSLDDSWDATCFIGAHAMAGTQGAFLEHTQSSRNWHNYWVNGRKTGELGQWAAVAGEFNVPMILVTGDNKACAEACDFFDPIVAVATKTGKKRMQADCLPFEEAMARVEAGAREAIKLVGTAKPFILPRPSTIRWEFVTCAPADNAAAEPGVARVGSRTVEKTVESAHYAVLPGLLRHQDPTA